jgi:hypothetical protein
MRQASAAIASVVAVVLVYCANDPTAAQQGCVTGFSPSTVIIPPAGLGIAQPNPIATLLTSSNTCEWKYDGWLTPVGLIVGLTPPWMGGVGPSAGTGPTTISVGFVAPNTGASPREEIFVFGGQQLILRQPVDTCVFTFSATTPARIPANGGAGTFTVNTSGTGCTYLASPGEGVTITSGATGSTFPATVGFSVAPNTSSVAVTRNVLVSSSPTPTPFARSPSIQQNGPPVATDAPNRGYIFAVHRPATGAPHITPLEPLRITNVEDPSATWSATSSEPWLDVTPGSGTSPSIAVISVDPAAAAVLSPNTYAGTIRLTSSVAPSTPLIVSVSLRITNSSSTTGPPFGFVDIPVNGATGLSGAVPVGGWAIDDVGISRVQIYRDAVAGESPGEVYIGDATRVRGARPDIVAQQVFGSGPGVTRAGWGLMLLSNVLPNRGNGTFTLSAYAEDVEGHRQLLGRTTVTFDNTNSPYPFGTIDVPGQGATVSGTLDNLGWVLAQPGRTISLNGSTIRLFVDGVERPNVSGYGFARADVLGFFPFPTYANANGPGVQFSLDTTGFTDGLHTIVWVASDDLGTIQGIGSRFFTIQNGSASQAPASETLEARSAASVQTMPQAGGAVLWERRGFDGGPWSLHFAGRVRPDVRAPRAELVEVALETWWSPKSCGKYAAYLLTGEVAGPLPPGASLDRQTGIFRWQPPVEFSGTYDFVFVRQSCAGREERVPFRVVLSRD